jgi:hypothetical protein
LIPPCRNPLHFLQPRFFAATYFPRRSRHTYAPYHSKTPDKEKVQQEMTMETSVRGQTEDRVTGALESQTSKIPSSGYLGAAIGSMAASAVLKGLGKDEWALFVGQRAPAFLIMGVYNKMVKQQGSDYSSPEAA